MELIGGLKEKFDAAQSVMEKKSILADAGFQLSDDELTEVSGGKGWIQEHSTGGWDFVKLDGPKAPKACDGAQYWLED